MKGKTIAYWVITGLFAVGFGVGAVLDVVVAPPAVQIMTHLGYPLYVAKILGVFKLLGIAAILAPGMPRVKEWAYAGIAFDTLGASASHTFIGDGVGNIASPILFLAAAVASYLLRPQSRVLGQLLPGQGSRAASTSGAPAST